MLLNDLINVKKWRRLFLRTHTAKRFQRNAKEGSDVG